MSLNPFDKQIGEKLDVRDLQSLITNEVAEGYFIEYKSDFPANKKIAKSIASLANTLGGWFFIGIEADKKHNTAKSICGFHLQKTENPIDKIREIIKSSIDPTPLFFSQVIELSQEKSVLAVYIPSNQNTPFICNDGRIYRRKADSSDPVAEKDRHSVDLLVENGRNINNKFLQFCRDERQFSESESETIWLKIYISPSPLGSLNLFQKPLNEVREELIKLSEEQLKLFPYDNEADYTKITGNLPFNFSQLTCESVILRQVEKGKTAFNSLTTELFRGGSAKFFIPIPYSTYHTKNHLYLLGDGEASQTLLKLWGDNLESDLSFLKFIDANQLVLSTLTVINFYLAWLNNGPFLPDVKIVAELTGIWRAVPFFQNSEWAKYVDAYGLPTIGTNNIKIPQNFEWAHPQPLSDEKFPILVLSDIALALGFSTELFSKCILDAITKAAKLADSN